jgi:hypothetical protein
MRHKSLWIFLAAGITCCLPVFGQQLPPNRPFAMSSSALQTIPGQASQYQNGSSSFSLNTLASDVDLISVFPEYMGIPFPEFENSPTPDPNDPWTGCRKTHFSATGLCPVQSGSHRSDNQRQI